MDFGLIGKKLGHSYSSFIHEQINKNGYELKELEENELSSFLSSKEFKGINVTIPYKEKVIEYLDEIDPVARNLHAVNTIINKKGKLIGYNTDIDGFIFLLKENDIKVKGKKVLILGSGASSKTVKAALIKLRAKEIYVVSHENKKDCITYQEAEQKFDINVIVNTTPYGMYPSYQEKGLINLDNFPYLEACVDLIYNPLKTPLIINAKEKGVKAVSGLKMLVKQAIKAEELFLNKKIDKHLTKKIYLNTLLNYSNIVFIGMPSSGKSTASRNVSEKLGLLRYDSDDVIKEKINMSIKEFFELKGEEEFRKIETEVIKDVSSKTGVVISVGGGSLTRKENINPLIRNSTVIFLNRDLELLKSNKKAALTRPLLNDKDALDKLYNERFETYKKYADIVIVNNGTKLNTLNLILKSLLK